MAASETSGYSKKDRAKDRRLRKEFGIDLAEHERRRAEQNNRCKICQREFVKPPHVDHFHFRIDVKKSAVKWWTAETTLHTGRQLNYSATTKVAAIRGLKLVATPHAIRALLCSRCNRGLGYMEDPRFFHGDPVLIERAASYLRNYLTLS